MEQDLLIIEIENLKVQHNELSGIISTINEKRESIIANFEEQINEKFVDNQEIVLRIREKKEGF
ncbi:MAG: hypothetical protein E7163_00295 [Firmicutes bacterium]|nr:hypothetical protein [Bacillota bacterium]